MKRLIAIAFSMTAALAACDQGGGQATRQSQPAAAVPAAKAAAQHAAADVTPGSHDDWCAEHGVPESQCTKCNPDLVPAFKATGDWCVEHGVPESHCTKCNPELTIVRPPKAE